MIKWNNIVKLKKREKDAYHPVLLEALERLETGDSTAIHLVYQVFVFEDKVLIQRGAAAIHRLLENYTSNQMMQLSEQFRQYTSIEWFIEWKDVDLSGIRKYVKKDEEYRDVLILGSFHPNGYYREKCMVELEHFPDTLLFLVLRMNDWAEPARRHAAELAEKKAENCGLRELVDALPALDKLTRSKRRDGNALLQLQKKIENRMQQNISEFTIELLSDYEFTIRKCIYRMLFSKKLFSMSQAEAFLVKEKHSFCQAIIMSGLLKNYQCSEEQIERFLHHKSACIRKMALEYRYDRCKSDWPGIEQMLLDPSHGIREYVVFILEHHRKDYDILQFYVSCLQKDDPVEAIIGIGEQGTEKDARLLIPFLNHNVEKVVKHTVLALGKLMGMAGYELFWNLLFDERVSVSKASYCSICHNRISYGAKKIYEEIQRCDGGHVQRYLVLLILKEKSWDRLPYLIDLSQNEQLLEFREKILAGLQVRNIYGRVSEKQTCFINEMLEKYGEQLPGKLAEEIRFDLSYVGKGTV